jgi:modulator of FtsH protease
LEQEEVAMGFPQQEQNYQEAGGAYTGLAGAGSRLAQGPADRLDFIRKVYITLLMGLGVGSVGCYLGAINGVAILQSGMFQMLGLAEFVFFLVTLVMRKKPFWNKLFFFGFNASFGAMVGVTYPMLAATGQEFVFWQAVGGTVAIFGGLTAYVFATRKDFNFLRGLLFMTCWGMFFVSILNYFLGLGIHTSMAWQMLGLVLVSGFILYDTSNVLLHYDDGDEVAAALELAWDFWYLLFRLIMIFMDRD